VIRSSRYRLFEVVGLELEYVIVDGDLRPRCVLEEAFRHANRRPTSDLEHKRVGFSNELAAHVFEIKTLEPQKSLARIEADLVDGLRFFRGVLNDRLGARLLPTGMHPFMRPADTMLWRRSGRAIYETYASLFPIRQHGWLNVQASHINLPFGSEARTVAMHNALVCLLPYLPSLAASSPIYEGKIGPSVDNRLEFYKVNQRRIPVITGQVVPEYIDSYRDYRRKVFAPIREAVRGLPGAGRLRAEWVNSRGAIMRFSRQALEIKLLDVQECIRSDIAIAVFVRGALRQLVRRLEAGTLALPDRAVLIHDLDVAIREGTQGRVQAPHLLGHTRRRGRGVSIKDVLGDLLEMARIEVAPEEREYLPIVESRIRRGNLSERIVQQVRRRSRGRSGDTTAAIRSVYGELMDCLDENRPWDV
jgi:gamma-glutamyl:cysteine ligase YbdK (ATP-grasp superfamily)